MSKRERQQSPATSRKRPDPSYSKRNSTNPTRPPFTDHRAHDSDMIRIHSPSLSSLSGTSTCGHRAMSMESCQTDQSSTETSLPSDTRNLTQLAVHHCTTMVTNGLQSPRSMRGPSKDSVVSYASHRLRVDLTPGRDAREQTQKLKGSPTIFQAQQTSVESFPIFPSGDVFIRTDLGSTTKHWQLHRSVLARHSPWFAHVQQSPSNTTDETDWYLYILKELNGHIELTHRTAEGDRPDFAVPKSDDILNRITVKSEGHDDEAAHASAVEIYSKIFGAFYSIPLHIVANDVENATSQVEELVRVARNLGCVHLISSPAGNVLLQYRQRLYKAILRDPPRYLLLATALENEFIYTESLIHLVGAYPCWTWPTKPSALPEEILRLIRRKSRELELEVLKIERELLLLTITTNRGIPYSAESHSQFDTWFIVQLFRDTLTNVFRQHDASNPSLKRGSLFRKIRAGGSTYMAYEDVRKMVQRVMPSAVETLGEDLKILKEFASEIVEDLARNELSLDVEEHKVGWMTCVKVEKNDVPWRAGDEASL